MVGDDKYPRTYDNPRGREDPACVRAQWQLSEAATQRAAASALKAAGGSGAAAAAKKKEAEAANAAAPSAAAATPGHNPRLRASQEANRSHNHRGTRAAGPAAATTAAAADDAADVAVARARARRSGGDAATAAARGARAKPAWIDPMDCDEDITVGVYPKASRPAAWRSYPGAGMLVEDEPTAPQSATERQRRRASLETAVVRPMGFGSSGVAAHAPVQN